MKRKSVASSVATCLLTFFAVNVLAANIDFDGSAKVHLSSGYDTNGTANSADFECNSSGNQNGEFVLGASIGTSCRFLGTAVTEASDDGNYHLSFETFLSGGLFGITGKTFSEVKAECAGVSLQLLNCVFAARTPDFPPNDGCSGYGCLPKFPSPRAGCSGYECLP